MAARELELARQYLARGFSLFEVPRPQPGIPDGKPGDGKTPRRRWGELQDRHPTDTELVEQFSGEPMNLAIVTGAISDVVVVDADDPAALRWCVTHLPYTAWQTETRRGFHLWFLHPGVRVPNRSRIETRDGKLAIDVRGDGGYVIAPGSIHTSGVEYLEAGDWSVAKAHVPRFWPGWLEQPGRPPRSAPARSTAAPIVSLDVHERARKYLAAIPRPEIGAGSDVATLSAACRLVRGFALCAAEAEALLWEWAGDRPGWTHEWIAEKVAHAERYGTEPIGGLK